ncbi:hypothetical protein ABT086_42020 [Streptomyces mirabilis]
MAGQQRHSPIGHVLHGDLVHLVGDLMPDLALAAVAFEAEAVEQDE